MISELAIDCLKLVTKVLALHPIPGSPLPVTYSGSFVVNRNDVDYIINMLEYYKQQHSCHIKYAESLSKEKGGPKMYYGGFPQCRGLWGLTEHRPRLSN